MARYPPEFRRHAIELVVSGKIESRQFEKEGSVHDFGSCPNVGYGMAVHCGSCWCTRTTPNDSSKESQPPGSIKLSGSTNRSNRTTNQKSSLISPNQCLKVIDRFRSATPIAQSSLGDLCNSLESSCALKYRTPVARRPPVRVPQRSSAIAPVGQVESQQPGNFSLHVENRLHLRKICP